MACQMADVDISNHTRNRRANFAEKHVKSEFAEKNKLVP